MFKHTKKILASLFILAGITLFISCQDEPTLVTPDASQRNLSKVTSFELLPGETLVSASLKLYTYSSADPNIIEVHNITTDWNCPVTWNSFAGAYDATVITTFDGAELGFKTVDITSTVQGWLDCDPNNGLLLEKQDIENGITHFWSNEYLANSNFTPYLYIVTNLGTYDVEPFLDTYIYERDPDLSYCSDEDLAVGRVTFDNILWEKQTLIKFDLQCTPQEEECETAYAYGPTEFCGLPGIQSNNWGWSRQITGDFSSTTIPIYAGAAQCDPTKGTLVGYLSIEFDETTNLLEVDYDIDPAYSVNVVHMWIGPTILPLNKKGEFKAAPGQYNYNNQTFPFELTIPESFYIAVHFEVCHFE